MMLGIREYPFSMSDSELKDLLLFIDQLEYRDDPHVTTTNYDFFENDFYVVKKLRSSFYDACSSYWNMSVSDYRVNSWVYVDWKDNPHSPYMHVHNSKNPYTLSGIMYLTLPGSSETTMFPVPKRDPYFLPKKLFSWFIFPSNLQHIAGIGKEVDKRYCLSADLWP
jgi:hypothetical protein